MGPKKTVDQILSDIYQWLVENKSTGAYLNECCYNYRIMWIGWFGLLYFALKV